MARTAPTHPWPFLLLFLTLCEAPDHEPRPHHKTGLLKNTVRKKTWYAAWYAIGKLHFITVPPLNQGKSQNGILMIVIIYQTK